jgi:hypothetical protein
MKFINQIKEFILTGTGSTEMFPESRALQLSIPGENG